MSARLVGAIDQGTTGTRFMLFDHDGRVKASAYREHRQITPRPGWVEHDPMEIWANTQQVIRSALLRGRVDGANLVAIGVTNQRETTIVWDRNSGRPYGNAIVWQDLRTRDLCARLQRQGLEATVRRSTGLRIATYFSGPKLRWMLDAWPGLRAAARRGDALFGTVDSWLIWWLTGGPSSGAHVTDATNASRTMLMDLRRLEWSDELLGALKIPARMLPAIRPSSSRIPYGMTSAAGPLRASVPVCGDLGDQQAALFGQACFKAGEAKNTYGTGSFLLLNTGTRPVSSRHGLLTTVAYSLDAGRRAYALEGSIAVTGAVVQWLRDNLHLIAAASETERVAGAVEDSGGLVFVPAFSGLFAPYWDMDARGAILGLTRYATREHLVRAALESICYQSREVADAMRKDARIRLRRLKVDGGAVRNDLLMQMQADILGVPVVRPRVDEATALGAAYAAGLAVGFWRSLEELSRHQRIDRVFRPRWDRRRREAGLRLWQRGVARVEKWLDPNERVAPPG
ncbi:MAG TPA: glycerol kinase GlpK [Candidatus Limnocylindrales bacterium]|nr:glycerol kinase GlpK [Candidatus Limnocylindrales bacterium]